MITWDKTKPFPVSIKKQGRWKTTVVYLSGPMSGYPNHNFDAFFAMAAKLRGKGYIVLNPAEFTLPNGMERTHAIFMQRDLSAILHIGTPFEVDVIAVLEGWRASEGADAETIVGNVLDKPILSAYSMLSIEIDDPDGVDLPTTLFLSGNMCAGKDFVGEQLVERCGFTRIALADPLKMDVAKKHGITLEDLNENKAMYRAELQSYGTERRNEDELYWVKRWAEQRGRTPGKVVCTDCRYLNEVGAALTMPEALVVRVQVSDQIRERRMETLYGKVPVKQQSHSSETELVKCPFHVLFSGAIIARQIPHALQSAHKVWIDMGKPLLNLNDRFKEMSKVRLQADKAVPTVQPV